MYLLGCYGQGQLTGGVIGINGIGSRLNQKSTIGVQYKSEKIFAVISRTFEITMRAMNLLSVLQIEEPDPVEPTLRFASL